MGGKNLADATIEAFHHAIGLRPPRWDQTVHYTGLRADLIDRMASSGLPFASGAEAIGELLAVVSQDRVDLHRCGLGQALPEAGSGRCGLVRQDLQIHPAGRAVDGHERRRVSPGIRGRYLTSTCR
jgi:hypothetical protein